MEGSEHRHRSDGGAGQIGRDVLGDGRQAENVDVQHLAGASCRLEIFAAVVPQPKVKALSDRRLLYDVRVPLELVADGRSDEIGTVGIESLLHHQIDLTQVDVTEVDGDLLGVGRFWPQVAHIVSHLQFSTPSMWMD